MGLVSKHIFKKVLNRALLEGISKELINDYQKVLAENTKDFVSFDLLADIYELGNTHLTPGFSVRVGTNMIPEDYGTLGLSWKTSWRAIDIFKRTVRFSILITNIGGMEVTTAENQTTISLNRPIYREGQALSNEVAFTVMVNMIRRITNKEINPIQVNFIHKKPKDITSHTNFFQCKINFSTEKNTITFFTKDLDIPTTKADKSISKFLLDRMEEEKKGIEKQNNQLLIDISILIKDALPSGIPTLLEISSHLGMSGRTLNRRLAENNITFRQLISNAQQEIAKYKLYSTEKSISEIAFLTGFSEQSAFTRAFKKWTSKTPMEFRKDT